jgi:hypothetical protein
MAPQVRNGLVHGRLLLGKGQRATGKDHGRSEQNRNRAPAFFASPHFSFHIERSIGTRLMLVNVILSSRLAIANAFRVDFGHVDQKVFIQSGPQRRFGR